METYFGITDAFGIESFIVWDQTKENEMEEQLKLLKLRAGFNTQRNAIVFKIFLSKFNIKKIKALINKKKYVKAGEIITKILDISNKTKLTQINKKLQEIYKLRGYCEDIYDFVVKEVKQNEESN